jgi:microcystin-dependent protein
MSSFFIGEIQMFGFDFPPKTWAKCDGQLMAISQNQALFSLLGTNYGGDGQSTFGLPDMRSRVPMHQGPTNQLGTKAGEENHTLNTNEIPPHNHTHSASNIASGATVIPAGNAFGTSGASIYATQNGGTTIPIGSSGASQPHNNIQPYTTINFCIALSGIFPSRN